MRMQVDRYLDRFFQRRDQVKGVLRRDQSGHVLNAEAVRTHALEDLGLVHEVINVVDIAAEVGLRQ